MVVTENAQISDHLIKFAVGLQVGSLDHSVRHECVRAILNAFGCIYGGSQHQMAEIANAALSGLSASQAATVIGRKSRTDILTACLLNALAGAAYSFDDTYGEAMLHPSVPVFSAMLACAEQNQISGEEFIAAFAAGIEIACRCTKALTVPPAEVELAWSQTGVAAGLGAAIACGRLLKLSPKQLTSALGIAASEAGGTRATHGSMAASLIYGRAAQSGLRAAILAARDFTSTPAPLENRFGYLNMFSKRADAHALVDGLGVHYEFSSNAYKPYPCGVVIHPAIDCILKWKNLYAISATKITRLNLSVSRQAITFASHPQPADDLTAKVSLHHWVAMAALNGKAGLSEGATQFVRDQQVAALRSKIFPVADDNLATDSARLSVELDDGRKFDLQVEHCSGSTANPMTDQQLERKFIDQTEPVVGQSAALELASRCWQIERLEDVRILTRDTDRARQ